MLVSRWKRGYICRLFWHCDGLTAHILPGSEWRALASPDSLLVLTIMGSHFSPGGFFLFLFLNSSSSLHNSQCPKLLALGSTPEEGKNYLKSGLLLTQRGHPLFSNDFSWALALHNEKAISKFSPQSESNFLQNMNSSAISLGTGTCCLCNMCFLSLLFLSRWYILM